MELLRFAVLGLATGSLYALVALGIVLTYRASGVLNFSAGSIGAAGAYTFFDLRDTHHVFWVLALVAALVVGAALGAIAQLVVLGRLRAASNLVKLIATLGIMTLVQGGIVVIWGAEGEGQPASILPAGPKDRVHVFGQADFVITKDRLIIIGIVLVLTGCLRVLYSRTLFGLATSAVAENRTVAAMGGWSCGPIELANFAISGALSAFAAVLLAPIVGLTPATLTLMIVPALAGALLGRFSSFALTVAGAMLIGVLESELQRFVTVPQLSGLPAAVPLLPIVVVAAMRGRARIARGGDTLRLPRPGTGHIPKAWVIGGAALAVAAVLTGDQGRADAITLTLGWAIVILSVVVVTGYCGQLSLCQYSLSGFGCWVTARLLISTGLPFEVAIVAGVATAAFGGLIVALPALRARNVDLAITTLALGLMIQALVFSNGSLTGGYFGFVVHDLTLFGVDVDPVVHSQRYAIAAIAAFTVAALAVANLRRGRAGLRLLAVRSNERAAAALGVGVFGAKLYAFAVGAALAGLAGVVVGFHANNVEFNQFDVFGSISALQFSVIGGIGWIGGAVLGGLIGPGGLVDHLVQSLWSLNKWLLVIGGGGVLAALLGAPEGQAAAIGSAVRHAGRRLQRLPRRRRPSRTAPISEGTVRRQFETVEVRGLSVRFGGVVALDNVDLDIRPGEVLGLIGPNGAGKTTLLDVVSGFTKQSSGVIRLGRRSIDRWSPDRRARAGVVRSFQGVELFADLTVRDNLLVSSDHHRRSDWFTSLIRPGRLEPSEAMLETIARFELDTVLDHLPGALPYGVARMVSIARAVCADPCVLFLDEPAAGLDATERAEVGTIIRRVARERGIAVVVIEHDISLISAICDRVAVLDFGHLIAVGDPDDVWASPAVQRAYLGEIESPDPVAAVGARA